VRSFAVEEATENYCAQPFDGRIGNWEFSIPDPTNKFNNVIRCNPSGGPSNVYNDISAVINKPYSAQVWCYVSKDFDGSGYVGIDASTSDTGLNGLKTLYNMSQKGTWQFLKKENVLATDTKARGILRVSSSFETGYVLFKNFQIEQKPFCTSFVDGSRSKGQLTIHLNLDVNNAVTNFWFKIGSIFELDSNGTRIIVFNGDIPAQNRFFIRADGYTNNATLKFYDSIDDAGPNLRSTMKNIDLVKWNMFTIVFDNGLIKIYLNENLLTQYTVSLNPIALKYLNIPENTPEFLKTGFWSNLYFGKYRKPDGTVIWTDEYIREVYEAKIPFPVSNKLSIY